MKLNVRLIRKVIKYILAEPRRYYQRDWIQKGKPGESVDGGQQTFAKCGTAACIAGWAYLLSVKKASHTASNMDVMSTAEKNLGIDRSAVVYDPFGGLPYIDWPRPFGKRYEKAKTPRGRARAAAQFLEAIIKTKGAVLGE